MKTHSKKGQIYKYAPFNQYSLSLLINNDFWLGAPDKLNDPFEGDFLINDIKKFHNETFIKKLLELKKESIIDDIYYETNLNDTLNSEHKFTNALYSYINSIIKERYGVTCFSMTPSNIQMWSHYADSHKGFCIIFDESIMLNSVLYYNPSVNYNKVTYGNKLPIVEIIDKDNQIDIPRDSDDFLFCKLREWGKEQEIRLLLNTDSSFSRNRRVKFQKESIKGIIFGSRMEYENVRTIMNYIENSALKGKVSYFFAKKDLNNSKIRIERMIKRLNY